MNDQCKHCTARGHIKKCLMTPCDQHESWYAVEQQKQIDKLVQAIDKLLLVNTGNIFTVQKRLLIAQAQAIVILTDMGKL